jgi:cobalamin biosynthesis protein CbiG
MKLRLGHPVRRGNDQADARLGLVRMAARDNGIRERTHDGAPAWSNRGDEAAIAHAGATKDAPFRRFHCSAKDDKKQGWQDTAQNAAIAGSGAHPNDDRRITAKSRAWPDPKFET